MAGLGRLVRDTVAHKETDKKRGEAVRSSVLVQLNSERMKTRYIHVYTRTRNIQT